MDTVTRQRLVGWPAAVYVDNAKYIKWVLLSGPRNSNTAMVELTLAAY